MALPVAVQSSTGKPLGRATPGMYLYDTECLRSGTALNQRFFFVNPQGSPDSSGLINPKGVGETNLQQQRMLPQANRFDLKKINFKIMPYNGAYNGFIPLTEYWRIFEGCQFTVQISNVVVASCFLISVPSGPFLNLDGANLNGTNVVGYTGATLSSNGLELALSAKYFPVINATESFQASIQWTSSITPSYSSRLMVEFRGTFYQPV